MFSESSPAPLAGQVALVAGATRGAGRAFAVELARAGAYVYATGRSSRTSGQSEINRPETIEDTADRMQEAGGAGAAYVVDHEQPDQVEELIARIRREHGRLDVCVNDIFGGDRYADFGAKLWEHDLAGGLRMLGMGVNTHLITAHFALPLMLENDRALLVEVTDGTAEYNANYRHGVGLYYDLVKANVGRLVLGLHAELGGLPVTVVGLTPGWLRSEAMLQQFGVTEDNWRDAIAEVPDFWISESPSYVARGLAGVAADPAYERHGGRILDSAVVAREYGVTDVDGSQPDCWRFLAEKPDVVSDPGLMADYR
ncbi:SDR family oxidoreductase [Parenemella sanctibonifatiensis]|uniref:Short-chain dehydrogenase n=1 Tax=Parenemella sanctibonifatiensis TaxID=2016505 RepID=A0A255ED06_9ACTN|nr:SDR family oxidoreductase [Parenemella sanctibonifatiensis]OYN89434.1 short-chain dehydrogenase [Parenemella sanctibonifatiensis]